MKKFVLLHLLYIAVSLSTGFCDISTENEESKIIDAASEIIFKDFNPKAMTINFIIALKQEIKSDWDSMINSLLRRCKAVVFIEDEDARAISHRQRLYNIIFLDDLDSFRRLYQQISDKTFIIDGYYMVLLVKGLFAELSEVTSLLWKLLIFNVNFLLHDGNGGIKVLSFSPFTKSTCGDTNPILIHQFNNSSKNMKSFYPPKIANLFQCPVKVVSFNCPPMMMIESAANGSYTLHGVDGEMLKTLAKVLNFNIDLHHIDDRIRWGALNDNGTSTGAMLMIMKNEADFTIGMYTITFLRSRYMTSSQPYFFVPYILIIPPGSQLTAFEKLFRPFQTSVWIMLLLTFVAGTIVITVIKFQGAAMRSFVFGAKIRNPYLNILGGFVGSSFYALPTRNFARILLMMYLLFCLVKRTLYQGALFQFLQADDRHREVQSIDELVDNKFNVYMMPSSIEHTQNMKFRKR